MVFLPLVDVFGDAPGPLRLAAALPTAWAVPVLTAAGLAADHHHRFRAVFERLDGRTGQVTRTARLVVGADCICWVTLRNSSIGKT